MCSIMGAIAGISGILGTMVAAGAQSQNISAHNNAADYNSGVALNNATIAAEQAKDARSRGKEDSKLKGMEVAKYIGSQKKNYSANGVELTGSADQALGDSAMWGEYDQNTIIANAEKEAWGYEVEQTNYLNSANMYQSSKKSNSVFGSVLTGMTNVGMGLATTYRQT